VSHLDDFPRQYAALENAMAAFGDNFDLQAFKSAFDTTENMDAYNRVQAVERGMGRVQNYVAYLAEASVNLAGLERANTQGSRAEAAFHALRAAKVIDANLCRRLIRAQGARSRVEHSYVRAPAGDVHRATELVHAAARDFLAAYRPWIEPLLKSGDRRSTDT
jgi:hypothetical protein